MCIVKIDLVKKIPPSFNTFVLMTAIIKTSPITRFFYISTAHQQLQLHVSPHLLQLHEQDLYGQILDKSPDIKTLEKLHSKIIVDQNVCSNTSLSIKLMRSYAACGKPRVTHQVFDKIPDPDKNVVFFNVMIRSYANNHFYSDALLVYKKMSTHNINPDHYTFPCVLKACSASFDSRLGLQIHASVVKVGLDLHLFIGNGLISMYGKCGFLLEARRVLDEMRFKDVVSWNSMVAVCAQGGHFNDALDVCKNMQSFGVEPNAGTMASLLPAVTNTSSENVMFVKDMFENQNRESLVSWNVMIAVYVNNSMPAEAVETYLQMESYGIDPDAITISSILPACGDLSALFLGRKIHKYVKRRNLQPNLSLENALIDMYAKCGCLHDAQGVFDKMECRDVVSWTSMISAYGMSGQGSKAVSLFSSMLDSGLQPDPIAFVSVLSACSHAGLLDRGQYYFEQMTERYKIRPRLEHFACMVDLFGRAGLVDEAYKIVKQMPITPNERVWGALLSACRIYSNMDIGIIAADHLFQLAPEQAGYYVLLSNIYAKAGKWKAVRNIRSLMKDRGVTKIPGISNVELNNQVYNFLAGDRSHKQSNEIYQELDILIGKMKEMGYVPETESALHDVEEEDKEYHLAVHSEKLAIAFVIINTKPGTPIRITKNLRVCGDCHIAAKLISKITEREIVVRDTNRFHHFTNGVCSCGDYW